MVDDLSLESVFESTGGGINEEDVDVDTIDGAVEDGLVLFASGSVEQ